MEAEVVVAVGQVEQVGDPVDLRDQQQLRYPNHHSNHFRLIPLISTLQRKTSKGTSLATAASHLDRMGAVVWKVRGGP